MFNFFRKPKISDIRPRHWDYDAGPGFTLINNGDSLQYVNADNSRIIYLSVLVVTGSSLLGSNLFSDTPAITKDVNGWQLKGTKRTANEVLVCVISFTKEEDAAWAKDFFDSVKAKV